MLDWSKPAKKYQEMVLELTKLMGIRNGEIPVINRTDHAQNWREWYAYYGFRKLYASQAIMRERDEKTVPTLSPFDFDAEFNAPRDLPAVPKGDGNSSWRPPTPEEKKRVEILMRELNASYPSKPKQRQESVWSKVHDRFDPRPESIQEAAE